ncbi:phosphocholine cytidylyltransferase family protein [Alicyclobacillus fastidiosus]|uniref:Phosphocholine cytidylyltransferase family protein n=1 Tax=Alicyclobacillus fastidiosus TaxID=392011 RepID=A0ABY6ZDB7_9BACL|nr:phosphocholine cytidylyltransferase family protein [Alicyclobacillus fastidiosus]WAH40883.1 phosphocholine cytidylyltransferase family protein [Alicyclobacillus fastidiosus]
MTATSIILAAGRSMRLRPLTDHQPKCLLDMGPKKILDWQLDALKSIGVLDVRMVVGYQKEMIQSHIENHHPEMRVTYIENPDFETTNTLYSLARALRDFEGDFYYMNADVVFEQSILQRLSTYTGGGFLAIDRKQCREEEVKVQVDNDQITAIGKHLDPNASYGEFIGVANFTGDFAKRFRATVLDEAVSPNEMKFFEHALNVMADKHDMFAVDITGLPCVEVDFPEDYEYAIQEVLRAFVQVDEG